MLSLEDALARILNDITPLPAETLPLKQAIGRHLASDALAGIDLPSFDNSAMDGYAVRSSDLAGASVETPVGLGLVGRIAAGQDAGSGLKTGECIRLFTGSPLPPGADAVVMQEDTEADGGTPGIILVKDAVKPWENIRFRGEDMKRGVAAVRQGAVLTPTAVGLLAACGTGSVDVHRLPRVALIASGNELREPGQALEPGSIFESNRIALSAALSRLGIPSAPRPLMPDTLEATVAGLQAALETADVVITTGGVSVGELDFLKPAFEKIGGVQEFWRVSIKPGKPFVFGRWKDRLWFGLPGNPVSAFITFHLLVRPALLKLLGAASTDPAVSWGTLSEPLSNRGDRRHFVRVRIDAAGNITSSGVQASHFQGSLAAANGVVEVAAETTLLSGQRVPVILFD